MMVMVVAVMVGGDAVDCKGASKQPGCGSLPAKQCCGFSSNATTIAVSTSTSKYQIHIHKRQIPVHLYHKLHDLIYSKKFGQGAKMDNRAEKCTLNSDALKRH